MCGFSFCVDDTSTLYMQSSFGLLFVILDCSELLQNIDIFFARRILLRQQFWTAQGPFRTVNKRDQFFQLTVLVLTWSTWASLGFPAQKERKQYFVPLSTMELDARVGTRALLLKRIIFFCMI